MPILETDVEIRLSGGAQNSNITASIGGAISNTAVDMATILHNLFDIVKSEGSIDGDTNYRIVYVKNTSTLTGPRCKALFVTNWQDQVSIGKRELKNVATPTLANESTAPDPAVTFSKPSTSATALMLGDLNSNDYVALYLRRVIAPGSAVKDLAGTHIRIEIDTPE